MPHPSRVTQRQWIIAMSPTEMWDIVARSSDIKEAIKTDIFMEISEYLHFSILFVHHSLFKIMS